DPAGGFLLPLAAVEDFVPESLINAQSSGTRVPDNVAAELERRLAPVLLAGARTVTGKDADDPDYDPASAADERERAMRAICIRRGQPALRAALLAAYGGRCIVTDCDIEDVLEAAHISPYSGPSSDHVCNGLLLRADIHTLFDCGLLAFDPMTRQIVLAARLKESGYAYLAGQVLREPGDPVHQPSPLCLAQRLGAMRQ
ncbi:MAG TPA: HNH endonuclease signature motif containing protein, partial [Vicinamibacterales bacterium]|nr:HNH endonuclease signature motif containing protein [Vicinamibacterales bacterium]